jgi:hypothetical protein
MVILVTRCVSKEKLNGQHLYEFHFKGYLKGEKVSRVKIKTEVGDFTVRDDYLIALKVVEIKRGTLKGSLLKYKRL